MPDILTPAQVAECRERAERATEGPWEAKCSGHDYPYIVAHGKQLACGEDFGKMPDAEFIAHARTDIPNLCATVEALREENERLRGLLRDWTDMDPLRYDSEYSCCPWCDLDYQNMKHELDCPFVLARDECGISSAPGS